MIPPCSSNPPIRILVVGNGDGRTTALREQLSGLGFEVVGDPEDKGSPPVATVLDLRSSGDHAWAWTANARCREQLIPVVWVVDPTSPGTEQILADAPDGLVVEPFVSAGLDLVVRLAIQRASKSEVALRERETRWSLALEGVGDGAWDWSVESNEVHFSRHWAEILGHDLDEIGVRGEEWVSRIHPDDREATLRLLQAHLEEETASYSAEHRLRAKDGTYRWILGRGRVIERGPDGRPLRMVGTNTDITHRKMAEEALRESEGRFRALIGDLEVGVVLQDAEDVILLANPAAERLLGGGEELDGVSSEDARWELIRPDGSTLPPEEVPSVAASRDRQPVRDQTVGARNLATGERVWLLVSAIPRLSEDGELIHTLVTVVDITAQRALEEQLVHAQKLQALGLLAGGVAHDFNNLLTVINGYGELIQRSAEAERPPRLSHVEAVFDATRRAGQLTEQLLIFGRRASFAPEVIDLNDLVRTHLAMLRRLIPETIEFAFHPHARTLAVLADRAQLEQVVMNLCLNARDAMPEGGRLTLELSERTPSDLQRGLAPALKTGAIGCLSIRDTGSGIEASIRDRIFEPFFTTKSGGRGTGLGLSTVYGVVQRLGGIVDFESSLSGGTTFQVFLPLTDSESQRRPRRAASWRRRPTTATILLVEDEEPVRTATRLALESAGLSVLEAADGNEALANWEERKDDIDLIVSDVVMPRLDGHELVQVLRARGATTPILLMSGYEPSSVSEHPLPDEPLIRKPFRIDELCERVLALLTPEA